MNKIITAVVVGAALLATGAAPVAAAPKIKPTVVDWKIDCDNVPTGYLVATGPVDQTTPTIPSLPELTTESWGSPSTVTDIVAVTYGNRGWIRESDPGATFIADANDPTWYSAGVTAKEQRKIAGVPLETCVVFTTVPRLPAGSGEQIYYYVQITAAVLR